MRFFLASSLLLSLLFFVSNVNAQKIDTVYHINGNIMTGDFKKMVYGVVTWKMDGMGTISLEEVKVNNVKSPKLFEVKLKSGLIYFGSFDTSRIDRTLNIVMTNGRQAVNIDEIVEIYPLKRNFWQRTSGNFSLGLNYSKGSDVATIALSGNLNYRKRKSYWYLSWDNNNTFQADTLSATKADVMLSWQRTLRKLWSLGTIIGFSQNSQLGTRARYDLTFLGIRDFVYNNWNRFYAGAGVSLQREIPYGDGPSTNDLAGAFTLMWKVYKYTNPKVWVDMSVTYIPYLTSKRNRVNVNINPQISIFDNNLKLGLSSYYSYDSDTVDDSSTNETTSSDWGINLQITYAFH